MENRRAERREEGSKYARLLFRITRLPFTMVRFRLSCKGSSINRKLGIEVTAKKLLGAANADEDEPV